MKAIETLALSKAYKAKKAVSELSLTVDKGSVYGFLGPNGSGKTTTVKMLLGLRQATKGHAHVLGFDCRTESLQIAERVGYVPENGNLYPQLTVRETINLVKSLRPTWDESLASRLLEMFELPLNQRVRKLSKGMQRQLALLVAMAPRPELLILDEPTSGLDPVKRHQFLTVLMENVAETEQTVFFSSHNMSEVERVADTVGIIHRGELAVKGNIDDLKHNIKRIRVVLPGQERPALNTQVRTIEGANGQWVITVDSGPEKVLAELNALGATAVETYDLSLEDIFLIYAGGEVK